MPVDLQVRSQQHPTVPPSSGPPLVTPEQLAALEQLAARVQQSGPADSDGDSDEEEPSPEALMRYMAMRRHTIGVGDSQHDAPQDVRMKLAHHKPILGMIHIQLYTASQMVSDLSGSVMLYCAPICIMLTCCRCLYASKSNVTSADSVWWVGFLAVGKPDTRSVHDISYGIYRFSRSR